MTKLEIVNVESKVSAPRVEQVRCHVCDGGVLIPARTGVTTDGKNVVGGSEQLLCAQCMSEGTVTIVF